jgi:hypothetical protein
MVRLKMNALSCQIIFNDHFERLLFFLYPSTCMTPDMVQLKMIALSCRMIFNGTQTSHGMNSCARLGHESVVVAVVMGVSSVSYALCRYMYANGAWLECGDRPQLLAVGVPVCCTLTMLTFLGPIFVVKCRTTFAGEGWDKGNL